MEHLKTGVVILSEAKDLLSCLCTRKQVLRFAQDDKVGGFFNEFAGTLPTPLFIEQDYGIL